MAAIVGAIIAVAAGCGIGVAEANPLGPIKQDQVKEAPSGTDVAVDLELVLAVDVSMSMMVQELRIQRDGYVAALSDPQVIAMMFSGENRRIALTYVEWSGVNEQRVVVPWTVLRQPADAIAFADQLREAPSYRFFRTSVSGALEFSAGLFDNNGIAGAAQVIDISGDGANNDGLPVTEVRDAAVAAGITINGLPLMTDEGLISSFEVKDLDAYYADCVIGGPGAFSMPVISWEEFGEAVRRKLMREISFDRRTLEPEVPFVRPVAAIPQAYDCLVGEKLWNRQQGK